MIILYSTGCPKCKVLEMKLNQSHIKYVINNNIDEMLSMGIKMAPCLNIDGELMDFSSAIAWLNKQESDGE